MAARVYAVVVLVMVWRSGRFGGHVDGGGHVSKHVVLDRVELRRGRQGQGGGTVCGGALEDNRGRLAV